MLQRYNRQIMQIKSGQFKRVEDLAGFVSDKELAEKRGKYTLKKLMTYKESCILNNDLGMDTGTRYDIEQDHMVWVFVLGILH